MNKKRSNFNGNLASSMNLLLISTPTFLKKNANRLCIENLQPTPRVVRKTKRCSTHSQVTRSKTRPRWAGPPSPDDRGNLILFFYLERVQPKSLIVENRNFAHIFPSVLPRKVFFVFLISFFFDIFLRKIAHFDQLNITLFVVHLGI